MLLHVITCSKNGVWCQIFQQIWFIVHYALPTSEKFIFLPPPLREFFLSYPLIFPHINNNGPLTCIGVDVSVIAYNLLKSLLQYKYN